MVDGEGGMGTNFSKYASDVFFLKLLNKSGQIV